MLLLHASEKSWNYGWVDNYLTPLISAIHPPNVAAITPHTKAWRIISPGFSFGHWSMVRHAESYVSKFSSQCFRKRSMRFSDSSSCLIFARMRLISNWVTPRSCLAYRILLAPPVAQLWMVQSTRWWSQEITLNVGRECKRSLYQCLDFIDNICQVNSFKEKF